MARSEGSLLAENSRGRFGPLLFGLALLCVVAIYAFTLQKPLLWLLGIVADDAFYYLKVAQNLAAAGQPTFDGIHPTNGYHPAWMLLMTLAAKLFPERLALLYACLWTAFLFHVAGSLCLVGALRRWVGPTWAWIGGAGWLVNPLPVFLALQGVEASFYIFALALALLTFNRRIAPALDSSGAPLPSPGSQVVFGLSLSLCVLGRTEALILSALAIAATLRALPGATTAQRLRIGLRIGGAFVVGIAPWFLYSYLSTGSWMQHSGAMKMLWAAQKFQPGARLLNGLDYLTAHWLAYPLVSVIKNAFYLRTLVNVLLTGALLVALWRGARRKASADWAGPLLFLLLTTLLTGSVYGLLFNDRMRWYTAQPGLLLYVVGFVVLVHALTDNARRQSVAWAARTGGAMVAALALALVGGMVLKPPIVYPWQRDVYQSQPQFEAQVPPGEAIGCFNAGIPAYFSDRTIVNLDGLINNSIYPYFRERRLGDYLREKRIRYIADEDLTMATYAAFDRREIPLRVLDSAPMTGSPAKARLLWRVEMPP